MASVQHSEDEESSPEPSTYYSAIVQNYVMSFIVSGLLAPCPDRSSPLAVVVRIMCFRAFHVIPAIRLYVIKASVRCAEGAEMLAEINADIDKQSWPRF